MSSLLEIMGQSDRAADYDEQRHDVKTGLDVEKLACRVAHYRTVLDVMSTGGE